MSAQGPALANKITNDTSSTTGNVNVERAATQERAAASNKSTPLSNSTDVSHINSSAHRASSSSSSRDRSDCKAHALASAHTPRYLPTGDMSAMTSKERIEGDNSQTNARLCECALSDRDGMSATSTPVLLSLRPFSHATPMHVTSATITEKDILSNSAYATGTHRPTASTSSLMECNSHEQSAMQTFSRTFRDKNELQLRSERQAGLLHLRGMLHETEAALEVARTSFFAAQSVLIEQLMQIAVHDGEYVEAFQDRTKTLAELTEQGEVYRGEYSEFLDAMVRLQSETTSSQDHTLRTMIAMLQATTRELAHTCLEQHSQNNDRVRKEREQLVREIVQRYESSTALVHKRDRIWHSIARLRHLVALEESKLRWMRARHTALTKELQARAALRAGGGVSMEEEQLNNVSVNHAPVPSRAAGTITGLAAAAGQKALPWRAKAVQPAPTQLALYPALPDGASNDQPDRTNSKSRSIKKCGRRRALRVRRGDATPAASSADEARDGMIEGIDDVVNDMVAARREYDLVSGELARVQDALVRAQTHHALQLRGHITHGDSAWHESVAADEASPIDGKHRPVCARLSPEAAGVVRMTVRHALEFVNDVLSCAGRRRRRCCPGGRSEMGSSAAAHRDSTSACSVEREQHRRGHVGDEVRALGCLLDVHTLMERKTIQNFIVRKVNHVLPHLLSGTQTTTTAP